MLINFETDLDREGVARKVVSRTEVPLVTTEVQVVVPANTFHTYRARPDTEWGWEELRDYVVDEIEKRTGPFPRKALAEASVFKRFVREFGPEAASIARYAFEVCDGRWAGAPISVNRFCKGSDEFFGKRILAKIAKG